MRTALLAAIKRDDAGALRALMPFAGRSVLGWQIDFARSLGCQRIMCLCEEAGPQVLALQREVEQAGAEFHLIRSNVQLVALLRSGDQVLMLLDGSVPQAGDMTFFDQGRERLRTSILVLPSEAEAAQQSPDDFERIDAQRSWAGMAIIDASIATKLADYPADSEAMSLLLRLALQAGVPCEMPAAIDNVAWEPLLATSRESLITRQNALISTHQEPPAWIAPLVTLSHLVACRIVTGEGRISGGAMLAGSTGLVILAAIMAGFGPGWASLLLVAFAAWTARCAVSIQTLVARLQFQGQPPSWLGQVANAVDLVAIAALIFALEPASAQVERLALPVFAIGLARIAALDLQGAGSRFWADRSLHLFGFAGAAIGGFLAPALTVFGIGALLHKLLQTHAK